MQSEEHFKALK
jgi:hypothetical protein